MAVYRITASLDNTITNAYEENLTTRGTGSNMGAADILEAFVIHGQTTASVSATPSLSNFENAEQSRILIEFPIDVVSSDMTAGTIPNSTGSVKFYLNLYNAPHGNTLPYDFGLDVCMASQSWTEGRGLDMDGYTDLGTSNWEYASAALTWSVDGASVHVGTNTSGAVSFSSGVENISLDVSEQVYKWLDTTDNDGFLIKFPDNAVSGSDSLYTKMFFARTSEFYFYRPTLEARWDSARKDNRGNFFISSSMASSDNNLNTLYMYNIIRGQLANIPSLTNDKLMVEIFSGSTSPTGTALLVTDSDGSSITSVTGGLLVENGVEMTGIYTASLASTSSLDIIYDVWHTGSGGSRIEFYTGSYVPEALATSNLMYDTQYITTLTNLASTYSKGQKPRIRVFTRSKDWEPNIYTVATSDIVPHVIENAYYRIFRTIDNLEVIPYGTGSVVNNFTRLSYDVSGNYFELDTDCLQSGYSYGIQLAYYLQGDYREQPEVFKFRIEEDEV